MSILIRKTKGWEKKSPFLQYLHSFIGLDCTAFLSRVCVWEGVWVCACTAAVRVRPRSPCHCGHITQRESHVERLVDFGCIRNRLLGNLLFWPFHIRFASVLMADVTQETGDATFLDALLG